MTTHIGAPPAYEATTTTSSTTTTTDTKAPLAPSLSPSSSTDSLELPQYTTASDRAAAAGVDPGSLQDADDEQRNLPEGWVRAFDRKLGRTFYVDETSKRAIWIHPYDDASFLASLPHDHPASPYSDEAKNAQRMVDEGLIGLRKQEERRARKAQRNQNGLGARLGGVQSNPPDVAGSDEKGAIVSEAGADGGGSGEAEAEGGGSWLQRQKNKASGLIGNQVQKREAKRQAAEEKRQAFKKRQQAYLDNLDGKKTESYLQRKKALEEGRVDDPAIGESRLLFL